MPLEFRVFYTIGKMRLSGARWLFDLGRTGFPPEDAWAGCEK